MLFSVCVCMYVCLMYEAWRSTLKECCPLSCFEAGFLTESVAAVLERLAAGWLDSCSQRSTCLCPPSTGFTDAHLNTWVCSLHRCWESELKSPGLHRESDFPTEPSPSHICLSSSLWVFCSTSVLYQDAASVLCEAGFFLSFSAFPSSH